ncbi:hypothetical protein AVEN_40542-1 [Araneus ventricosus]|uniref:Uncharacterized protein n=1 Tax=Araneus ventricosus TaxID=182803 RepID=A0A4Y2X6L2_ARAVE|nr:hypothetical protein AVEN_40542-1 [Araneus ventricosus]
MVLKVRCNSFPCFQYFFISPEDCGCASTSSCSDKLTSTISCSETQCDSVNSAMISPWLWSSIFHELSFPTSSPMVLAKDKISLSAGFTGIVSNPWMCHSITFSCQSFFEAEVRVLLVTSSHVLSIIFRQVTK